MPMTINDLFEEDGKLTMKGILICSLIAVIVSLCMWFSMLATIGIGALALVFAVCQ